MVAGAAAGVWRPVGMHKENVEDLFRCLMEGDGLKAEFVPPAVLNRNRW